MLHHSFITLTNSYPLTKTYPALRIYICVRGVGYVKCYIMGQIRLKATITLGDLGYININDMTLSLQSELKLNVSCRQQFPLPLGLEMLMKEIFPSIYFKSEILISKQYHQSNSNQACVLLLHGLIIY